MTPFDGAAAGPCFRLRGEVKGALEVYDLGVGEHRLGSLKTCDLVLPVEGVSREHALLKVESGALVVEDAGSKNGTFVDGDRIRCAAAAPGAELRFGPVRLKVEALEAEARLAIRFDDEEREPTGTDTQHTTAEAGPSASEPRRTRPGEAGLVFPEGYLPGRSKVLTALYGELHALCRSRLPILIHGETGSGKEMVARILHLSSDRAEGPFVAVNCAAIPGELMEAELFGVVKGAATGVGPRQGTFERAEGGTLLLDEIGELDPALQPKLLRALQENEVQPVGGRPHGIDVRLLAATNVDLERGLGERLRPDLYYRLAGSLLEVPSMRRYREDVPELVAFFLRRYARRAGTRVCGVTAGAVAKLRSYDWPGNVRELEHEMHRLAIHAGAGAVIGVGHLAPKIRSPWQEPPIAAAELDSLALAPRLEGLERALIREALLRTGGRLGEAARLLGISRNGLAKKLKRLDLKDGWALEGRGR